MDKPNSSMGKIFPVFAGICLLALPLIVYLAVSPRSNTTPVEVGIASAQTLDFDYKGSEIFENYQEITQAYLNGTSPVRTLEEYYTRRQYWGAPPFIPHQVTDPSGDELTCLTCHEKGGWTEELQRHTPLTPHPENSECRQCHVTQSDIPLFVENLWTTAPPPKLGRSYLPGSPPPIVHSLQMRENCIACHVGPAAVEGIRVNHASRGNCRQCHVPDSTGGLFERPSTRQ